MTSGATEALAAAFYGFLEPGDEAVLLAPFYECYAPQIEATGAVCKLVNLAPPEWRLDADALESAITPKTKWLILNSPSNPTCAAYTWEEMKALTDVLLRHPHV